MTEALTVSRDDAVLVLVDMQCRLADVMARRGEVVATSILLATVSRLLGIPTIVTRQYPKGLGDTVPELLAAIPGVTPVDKMTFSCLGEPAFREQLAATRRRQVVIAGMETHVCVAQTALGLVADGNQAFVVADATCSRRSADHEVALDRLRAAGAVVTTAESVIYEALERAGTPEFRAALDVVKAHPLG